jgi:NTP pyrophosphatase (non-canonical NTP hydrolase)
MDLNDVISESKKTWKNEKPVKYDEKDLETIYVSLALGGEVGELQNKIKKYFRRKYYTKGHSEGDELKQVGEEVADILYYLGRLSELLDMDPSVEFMKKMEENKKRYLASK